MEEPEIPLDEQERLESLNSLNILDSSAEERFDRYTRLLQRIMGVPIALVSLVDEDRQWFKSRQGLEATETPREISFCGHAILRDDVFVVENAVDDERFCDNPLVAGEPNIRFYAGFPIQGQGGYNIGTLCAIDRKPRTVSEDDVATLRDLAALVSNELVSYQLATTDELTGLPNRRGFEMLSNQALANANRSLQVSTVALIDLNGFKHINDTLGHEAGDGALVDFARLLYRNFRANDIVARLGGDEFCALLVDTDESTVVRGFDRLEDTIRVRNRTADVPLAFSVGLSTIRPGSEKTLKASLAEADERMYEDKRRRRQQLPGPGAASIPGVQGSPGP